MTTIRDEIAKVFPRHNASLHLTHNQHKSYYESIEEHYGSLECPPTWVSDEQKQKALAADDVWELQWYPNTPVGSYSLLAHDLDVLLEAARAIPFIEPQEKR